MIGRRWFNVIDVKPRSGDPSSPERRDKSRFVDNRTSARVDQISAPATGAPARPTRVLPSGSAFDEMRKRLARERVEEILKHPPRKAR